MTQAKARAGYTSLLKGSDFVLPPGFNTQRHYYFTSSEHLISFAITAACYSYVTCATRIKRPHLSVVKFLKNKVLRFACKKTVTSREARL